jgi:endonuclease/exonuclease/phosphatase family metal-dependent hydrolase
MSLSALFKLLKHSAPRFLGAVFCASVLLGSSGCKKSESPDWSSSKNETPASSKAAVLITPAAAEEAPPPDTAQEAEDASLESETTSPAAESGSGLRFVTYNVENWLTMDRQFGKKGLEGTPKPEIQKQAIISIIARHTPDVVGLCEVGTPADLAEIQERLKAAGLDLPHSHYTGGADPTRHLAVLSRFPITSTTKAAETEYQLAGQTFAINRGILDATLQAGGKSYRFIGVHLKSKRDSQQGDQEVIRLNEAHLIRRHVDSILKSDPTARLIVYGDFNDTKASPPIKTVSGKYNEPDYLTAIPAKDSHNEAWTQHWALQDIYSRFDFIMVSRGIRKDVDFRAAQILDDPESDQASDHRAVMAVFR